MAPKRQSSAGSRSSSSSFLDAFRRSDEEQPGPRLAIKTREGEQVLKLPSGTRVLVIHNSDATAQPHHLELGEVTILGPTRDFLRWYCYAVLTAAVCLGLAGLLLFFLFPRVVEIQASKDRIFPHYRDILTSNESDWVAEKNVVTLKYNVKFRVVNNNYIPITIEEINSKVQIFETAQDNFKNNSQIEVPIRSNVNLSSDVVVRLSHNLGFMAKHCNDPKELTHTLDLKLDVTIRYRTMLGREGRIVETWIQKSSCGPEGKEEKGGEQVREEHWKSIMEGQGSAAEANRDKESKDEGVVEFHKEKDVFNISESSPEGRPASPEGRLALSKGRPALAEGRPALAEGRPASPEGRPALAKGQPASVEGQPLSMEGLPESPGSPNLSEGRLAMAEAHLASREGRPLSPEGRTLPPNGRPSVTKDRPQEPTLPTLEQRLSERDPTYSSVSMATQDSQESKSAPNLEGKPAVI